MLEIELKILEIDKEKLLEKLQSLGAEKLFEGEIYSESYINRENKKIRLRRKGDKNYMDYKFNIESGAIRVNNEFETMFEDFDIMREILISIGFSKYKSGRKYRISYLYDGIRYDFDKYEGIPWFIEVESSSKSNVEKGVILLGYNMEDTSPLTIGQVLEYYGVPK